MNLPSEVLDAAAFRPGERVVYMRSYTDGRVGYSEHDAEIIRYTQHRVTIRLTEGGRSRSVVPFSLRRAAAELARKDGR